MENKKRIGIIYMYTSPSGKLYIGQTINETRRKSQHRIDTIKTDTYFGRALRKYGYDNFKYEVLFKVKSEDKRRLKIILDLMEKKYISHYKSNQPETGYNLNKGGDGNLGFNHTPETIEVIRQASIDYFSNPENREKLSQTRKQHCETHKPQPPKWTEERILETRLKQTNRKIVLQYDLKFNLLNRFNSIGEAAKSLEGTFKTNSTRISECCNNKAKTFRSYIWMFE